MRILVPGWDRRSSEVALELAARHPDLLDVAVGVHPHHAAATTPADWRALEALAADPAARAIGEIGLDYHRNLSPPSVQRDAFARQLDLAARVRKPVVVHDRDAHADVLAALLAWAPRAGRATPGMLHCFSGDTQMAAALAAAGFLVSFALPVSFSSNHATRAAAMALAGDDILVETDSPYLGVAPDRRNEPPTTIRVAAALARLRETEPQTIALSAAASYRRLVAASP